MRPKILLLEALLAFVIIMGFRLAQKPQRMPANAVALSRASVYQFRAVMSCSPDWSQINADSLGLSMGPLPGWGNYSWKINTHSDSAQFYFNQGINMYYAFHIIESMASFKKAGSFDPTNPMIWWGQALAYGPNINDIEYASAPDAFIASRNALKYDEAATAREAALIRAMLQRYSKDTSISREKLNEAYAVEMKKAAAAFPSDADVQALYADARMLQHPWDYWLHNGKPQPWTNEIVSVLEKTLRMSPSHPGANHYYIHTVEASPNPGRALPSADRLGKMMPQVSHMVHMPSHIYIRTGNYQQGITVNEMSINGFNKYKELYPDVMNGLPLYLIHNLHMQTACAMMRPNYTYSIESARSCAGSFDSSFLSLPQPMGNITQYVYMVPQMVQVRYGKWEELLQEPEVSDHYVFASGLSKWARGMALANTHRVQEASDVLRSIQAILQDPSLAIANKPFNKAIDQLKVAVKILEGTIAEKQGETKEALNIFKQAVILEDALIYTEPRDWLIPTRHYYASALIHAKQYVAAEKTLKEDLQINPENYYSLAGLRDVYIKLKNVPMQAAIDQRLRKVYTKSDMPLASLIY